ncbi:16S pseudouridine synthase [Oceanobacillus iheyensis HTE831]|uniref:Pseudouridine synthase n=2 Tax=Oceanobacillus iheyensis TaxID=182710 RepID=Q8EP20_OCEIH|nr:16S pseudouridine synthase [Oceanobacillus iheyensis HTE831]
MMRLDKLLSNMGVGSRKEVKQLLKSKRITVNEVIVKDSGMHVDPEYDQIFVDDQLISYQKHIYLMMHKPPGVVSATVDNRDRTVIDLLSADEKKFEPFPVGRLDKDTEGLLLITNDGELAHRLTSPKKHVEKVYIAHISGEFPENIVEQFQEGLTLEDGYQTKPAKLEILNKQSKEVKVTITEGKYHQIKRMFIAVGCKVTYLKRVQMANLQLDDSLPIGDFRPLTEDELQYCKSLN